MTNQATRERLAGWLLSGAVALALLCAAAAIAFAAERQAPVLFLDLAALPPAAPALAAVAEAAPQVVDEAPTTPDEPAATEPEPRLPEPDLAPKIPASASMALPKIEAPVTADLALPPPPEKPAPKAEAPAKDKMAKAEPDPKPERKKAAEKPKTDKKPKAEKPKETTSASASAPKAAGKTKSGGAMSPAAYAKAVMKKVRSTRKKSGAGRGTVVVGFTIGKDGGLAGVKVLQSSGDASLDKTALDHIRRSAPFPVPPEGAGRSYSFEFVGK